MSKAQDLYNQRNENKVSFVAREQNKVTEAESMESYYENILTDEDIEKAISEYGCNYTLVQKKFIEKTRIQGADVGFLFFAVMLQCARWIVLNKLTANEKANEKGGREDKLHETQEKTLNKFSEGNAPKVNNLYASLEAIITTRGVPYDATGFVGVNWGIFTGAKNHRFSTLGHDPVLGLVFGTANILTNTITTNKLQTYHVNYDVFIKNPRIGTKVGKSIDGTIKMLGAAIKRLDGDIKSVVAAVIKQLIHIATDLYTPCGISLPGAGLVLDKSMVESLTKYISTGDVIKAGVSAGISVLINYIISIVHGCKLLYTDDGSEYSFELYQARTRKIIMYSNIIASSSNLIATAVTGDAKNLDIGGLLVTVYRLFNDTKFICKLEYEFLNSGLSKIYDERYSDVKDLFE